MNQRTHLIVHIGVESRQKVDLPIEKFITYIVVMSSSQASSSHSSIRAEAFSVRLVTFFTSTQNGKLAECPSSARLAPELFQFSLARAGKFQLITNILFKTDQKSGQINGTRSWITDFKQHARPITDFANLTNERTKHNKVSLLGVDSLWGDCTFIPADWGS